MCKVVALREDMARHRPKCLANFDRYLPLFQIGIFFSLFIFLVINDKTASIFFGVTFSNKANDNVNRVVYPKVGKVAVNYFVIHEGIWQ